MLLNAMEPIVMKVFDEYTKSRPLKCACEKCKLDIILLTLNHLPPKYTSSQSGEAYIKVLFMQPQMQSDVLKELASAVSIIENHPNHESMN